MPWMGRQDGWTGGGRVADAWRTGGERVVVVDGWLWTGGCGGCGGADGELWTPWMAVDEW